MGRNFKEYEVRVGYYRTQVAGRFSDYEQTTIKQYAYGRPQAVALVSERLGKLGYTVEWAEAK